MDPIKDQAVGTPFDLSHAPEAHDVVAAVGGVRSKVKVPGGIAFVIHSRLGQFAVDVRRGIASQIYRIEEQLVSTAVDPSITVNADNKGLAVTWMPGHVDFVGGANVIQFQLGRLSEVHKSGCEQQKSSIKSPNSYHASSIFRKVASLRGLVPIETWSTVDHSWESIYAADRGRSVPGNLHLCSKADAKEVYLRNILITVFRVRM